MTLTSEDISRFEGLVPAHEDVQMYVRLGEGGHVWVLDGSKCLAGIWQRRLRTADTILRSIRVRIGAWRPYIFRCRVSFRLSCVSSHYEVVSYQ